MQEPGTQRAQRQTHEAGATSFSKSRAMRAIQQREREARLLHHRDTSRRVATVRLPEVPGQPLRHGCPGPAGADTTLLRHPSTPAREPRPAFLALPGPRQGSRAPTRARASAPGLGLGQGRATSAWPPSRNPGRGCANGSGRGTAASAFLFLFFPLTRLGLPVNTPGSGSHHTLALPAGCPGRSWSRGRGHRITCVDVRRVRSLSLGCHGGRPGLRADAGCLGLSLLEPAAGRKSFLRPAPTCPAFPGWP